jgi:hypothetical protein
MVSFDIEVEPEVRTWLDSLSDDDYGRAEFYADLLADNAETLGEPYSTTWEGRSGSFDSTSDGSRYGSRTGSHRAGG